MRSADRHNPRQKKPPKPLDRARLEELALAYVARFATSAAKLEAYLARKLRERGWDGDGEPDIAALVSRYAALGYVDDASYARVKAGGLLRRGYGPRRVSQALNAAGISQEIREGLRAGAGEQRRAVLALARKRRFGPFAATPVDRAMREKQIAAMLRAGHSLDNIRELVDAPSPEAAEEWAAGPDEVGPGEEEWS
ncbi:RecX family transcriptional regulator [Altererythrobacter sp. CC-YST694]|uniref:regulatory protein RecX n=1 Tax=Altererythrobacter sp. CC-YST694 TaxID=2755038 RepID=UPI0039AFD2E4|nr:RecX family transcriptional regulator [Altererythrobacter sp. CC-YST694]